MLKPILAVALATCIVGCSGIKFTQSNINIVMAKSVEKDKGATGITDIFTLEGKIFVYATFKWDEVEKEAGRHKIGVKWYSDNKLISTQEREIMFGRPPHYVWFSTSGTSLGAGKAKVEIYADGLIVGSKNFEVVTK